MASLIRLLTFFEASAGMISAVYAEIEAKRLEVAFKSASDNDRTSNPLEISQMLIVTSSGKNPFLEHD